MYICAFVGVLIKFMNLSLCMFKFQKITVTQNAFATIRYSKAGSVWKFKSLIVQGVADRVKNEMLRRDK